MVRLIALLALIAGSVAFIVSLFDFKRERPAEVDSTVGGSSAQVPVPIAQPLGAHIMPPSESPAPRVPQTGPPVTEEEAQAFAESLQDGIAARASDRIRELLKVRDWDIRTISDLDFSEIELQLWFKRSDGSSRDFDPLKGVLKALDSGGTLKLLRVRDRDERKSLLFRLFYDDGSANYFEITLARFPDGSIGMEDTYNYSTGEMVSQTFRRLLISSEAAKRGKRVSDDDKLLFDNLETVFQMARESNRGRFAEAIEEFHKLPQRLQDNKSILLMNLRNCTQLGEGGSQAYDKGVERFRQLFPKDVCVDFISVDYLAGKKRFDEALAAIDRFEKEIGGDANMSVWRAKVLLDAEHFDEARKHIDMALKAESTLEEAYWTAIDISLAEKKFAETLTWLKKTVQNLKIEIEPLEEEEVYADFVKSPQYREWQEWYRMHKMK